MFPKSRFSPYTENLKIKQKIPRTSVNATTCSGAILGPTLSSSKYLTKPAPLIGMLILSFFFGIIITLYLIFRFNNFKLNKSIIGFI